MKFFTSYHKSKTGQSCPVRKKSPPFSRRAGIIARQHNRKLCFSGQGCPLSISTFIFLLSFLFIQTTQAQTTISGTITDEQGEPIIGANVYLENTYDGASSDLNGKYSFSTEETGAQTLVVSAVGYKKFTQVIFLSDNEVVQNANLEESIDKMNGVVINAGAFEASDRHKAVVLKPLDIVTTAGALGDIAGAINTLPGTQTVGESGRLFVRGGDSYETKTFIDGTLVHQPYNATIPNVPTRGRYSPFLFKGTTFSTGGYSAAYGQALSSALILETKDFPDQTQTDISLMTVGADFTHQQLWEKTSVSVKGEYTNLLPYMAVVPQDFDWEKAPEAAGTSLVFRQKTSDTGLLKFYTNYTYNRFALNQPNINSLPMKDSLDMGNHNFYVNTSYREAISKKWMVQAGLSYTYNKDLLDINRNQLRETDEGFHSKLTFVYDLSERVALRMGGEYFRQHYQEDYSDIQFSETFTRWFENDLVAGFIEADIYLSNKLVARAGGRIEYSTLFDEINVAPRLSLAYKTGENSQASLAYGEFFQTPENEFLTISKKLTFEHARHWIANYQIIKNDRIFRLEAYWKKYSDLVRFASPLNPKTYENTGEGFARGIDIFWRDRQTIKNGDYWVSYSFLDTQRNYRDFPVAAMPTFASRHNFSVVYKHFVTGLKTQFGASYSFASGRPYENPNNQAFHADFTKSYHNLSLNAAYLIRQNIILYAAATNVLGTDNVFGYEYATQPNEMNIYDRMPIRQGAKHFLFMGLFITLTKDKTENQLDNL